MSKKIIDRSCTPLIVLGMHRSGTTLVSNVLDQLGLFMGSDKEVNNESLSFLLLNDKLLHFTHSFWDEVSGAYHFFDNIEAIEHAVNMLNYTFLDNAFFKQYLGRKKFDSVRGKWGWKDPRNTITFPLWLSIFPNAKFVFVYRNGVDVANSLTTRETNQKFDITVPAYSSRSRDMASAFQLWQDYNRFYLKHKLLIAQDNVFEIRYESFLGDPAPIIHGLANFAGIETQQETIEAISATINRDRAFSFVFDKEHQAFYQTIKDGPLMEKFGYNAINYE